MKLKTLKYLKEDPINMKHCNWVVSCLDLKQETINHIKELEASIYPKPKLKFHFLKNEGCYAKIAWIKYFFNITEEDLK